MLLDTKKLFTVPKMGPMLYSLASFQAVSLLAGTANAITQNFRWPRSLFVTGILIIPQSADPADAGNLTIRLQDETSRDIISDGQGFTFAAPGLALNGVSFGSFPLQRPVADGDIWVITLTNISAVPITVAGVFLEFEEGLR